MEISSIFKTLPYEIVDQILYFLEPKIKTIYVAVKTVWWEGGDYPGFDIFYCVKHCMDSQKNDINVYLEHVPIIRQLEMATEESFFDMIFITDEVFFCINFIQDDIGNIQAVYMNSDTDSFLWGTNNTYRNFIKSKISK